MPYRGGQHPTLIQVGVLADQVHPVGRLRHVAGPVSKDTLEQCQDPVSAHLAVLNPSAIFSGMTSTVKTPVAFSTLPMRLRSPGALISGKNCADK